MYDLIIIGSGPAGLSAALYAGRYKLKTLVIGAVPGGLMINTDLIENYPGFLKLSGIELTMKLQEQVQAQGIELKMEKVTKLQKSKAGFQVKTDRETFESRTLIIATGGQHRHLKLDREQEFENHGISYCANCDAPLYKGKTVGVIGGSDTAVRYTLLASEYAQTVHLFYRKEVLRAEPSLLKALENKPNIQIRLNVTVDALHGEQNLSAVSLNTGEKIELQGLFVAIGQVPESELAQDLQVTRDEQGFIVIDRASKTNVKGVYAAGDVTNSPWKQIIIGNAEGAFAAFSAYEYLKNQ